MIGSIIKTLNTIPVITAQTREEYRCYLAANYPQLALEDLERVLDQLLNQTLDQYLAQFTADYRQDLKELLLDSVMSLQPFAVYASDVFKAGLKLAHQSPEFYREIAQWAGQFEFSDLRRDTVVNYILQQKEPLTQPVIAPDVATTRAAGPTKPEMLEDSPTVLFPAVDSTQSVTVVHPQDWQKSLESTAAFENPYCMVEVTTKNQLALPTGSDDFYLNLVTRLEAFEQTLKVFLHKNRGGYRKSAIAALLVMLTLGACLWLFNNRTRAKEQMVAPGQPQLAVASTIPPAGTKQGPAKLPVQAENQPPAAEVAQSQVKREYNRPSPIPAAPNTIIVGYIKMKTPQGIEEVPVRRYFERKLRIKATAYDLSVASCGKDMSHPEYGITRTGTRAKRGRTIAVDPRIIPLGRKVYIKFPKKYQRMNGIYVAEDTGSKIKGYRIDIFLGEDRDGNITVEREARRFGHRKVEVFLLQE